MFWIVPRHFVPQRTGRVGVLVGVDDASLWRGIGLSGADLANVEFGLVSAIGFERCQAGLFAHVIFACDRIVVGKRVDNKTICCAGVQFDGKAAVLRRMVWTRRKYLIAAYLSAESASKGSQIYID